MVRLIDERNRLGQDLVRKLGNRALLPGRIRAVQLDPGAKSERDNRQ